MELKREIDWVSVKHNHTQTTEANGMKDWWTVMSNAVKAPERRQSNGVEKPNGKQLPSIRKDEESASV
ncbi:hypothetical protein Csa_013190 [Cucumis sativus]|uniref:Uncharacterized protein n=1 Tax=Cucumis sativus TaxID=3659 RepID=A0A0A0LUQ9_CUCSA|nr:hypothetical protein Csa_013190 [Cucumis sativus]